MRNVGAHTRFNDGSGQHEEIQSTLDFYYSNSATFRRLVNYIVERSINDDVDTNKCEVKI
ncbi:DUF4765 family protein, partial [Salmonella enterica subsp. enterica serovar Montevideo]|nr:DUF4765 family protein [Salmonella enterica subsp. enterica serovar Montevideo]